MTKKYNLADFKNQLSVLSRDWLKEREAKEFKLALMFESFCFQQKRQAECLIPLLLKNKILSILKKRKERKLLKRAKLWADYSNPHNTKWAIFRSNKAHRIIQHLEGERHHKRRGRKLVVAK